MAMVGTFMEGKVEERKAAMGERGTGVARAVPSRRADRGERRLAEAGPKSTLRAGRLLRKECLAP